MDDASSTWRIFAALGLIALNAFFVASEFAIVKVRSNRMKELADNGKRSAALVLRITQQVEPYILTCQTGITMTSIALGWVAAPAVKALLEPGFAQLGASSSVTHSAATLSGFLVASFFYTVLGEQVPKLFSTQKAETVALLLVHPLQAVHTLVTPFTWLISVGTKGCLYLLGIRQEDVLNDGAHTEEEIRAMMSSSQQQGILEEHEVQLVENVLDYSDRVVREIITPRNDVTVLYTDQTLEEAVQFALSEGYTRYPLCKGERDYVVGIVHIRDMFALHCSGEEKLLEEICREPLIVPETLPLPQVRKKFQESNLQMAVVVDEYGSFAGIVTLEDMIEEVFGNFRDEFDEVEPEMVRAIEDGLELDAGMLVEEALEALEITSEVEVNGVDTIGGLVFSLLANKPSEGDAVSVDGYRLEVAEVEGLRITRIRATRHNDMETVTHLSEGPPQMAAS